MKKSLKRLSRDCVRLVVISVIVSLGFFIYNVWDTSSHYTDTRLWLQSTERQLKNQNESYYNELYDRYSRVHRDLNNYQSNTQIRLRRLENRISSIEDAVEDMERHTNSLEECGENTHED